MTAELKKFNRLTMYLNDNIVYTYNNVTNFIQYGNGTISFNDVQSGNLVTFNGTWQFEEWEDVK